MLARCLFPILPHTRAPGRGRLFGFDHLERGLSMGRCATIGMCSYNIPQRTAVSKLTWCVQRTFDAHKSGYRHVM